MSNDNRNKPTIEFDPRVVQDLEEAGLDEEEIKETLEGIASQMRENLPEIIANSVPIDESNTSKATLEVLTEREKPVTKH